MPGKLMKTTAASPKTGTFLRIHARTTYETTPIAPSTNPKESDNNLIVLLKETSEESEHDA